MSYKDYNPTSVNEYFAWLEKNISANTALHDTAHTYMEKEREVFAKGEAHDGPFLTVITRTQGKRPEMLTEMLLCLTAQSNTDFELLIMGHNLSEEQHALVSELIDDLPEWMQKKTRLIPVNGGTRTTPLNRGFEEARGKYISVLDDDDLVFDHWVEAFYNLHKKHNGTILHAFSVMQDWETVGNAFPNTPRAAGAPNNRYCCKFNLYDELKLNTCPLCALAFPAYVFKSYGLRFDESLTTTEDWDYLVRCAMLVGVSDTKEITFLYRIWLNAENSASVHNQEEWMNNYNKIVKRFFETPILMPPKTLPNAAEATVEVNEATEVSELVQESTPFMQELFYNDGEGFAQKKKFHPDFSFNDKSFTFCFVPKKENIGEITEIRFDPYQYGYLTLTDLLIRVVGEDGTETDYTAKDVKINGRTIDNRMVFLKNDPQILLTLKTPVKIRQILIGCTLTRLVLDHDIEAFLINSHGKIPAFFYRAVRKLYRIAKKILRR